MTQKGRQGRHGNAIGEMAALRWEPTHITKHCPRVVPLQSLLISIPLGNTLRLQTSLTLTPDCHCLSPILVL